MKKLRVLLCLIFVAVFVPWGAACKKTEESAPAFYELRLAYNPETRTLTGEETFAYENRRDSAPRSLNSICTRTRIARTPYISLFQKAWKHRRTMRENRTERLKFLA